MGPLKWLSTKCRFHILAFDTLEKCWPPFSHAGRQYNMRAIPPVFSFSHPVGIMVWAAQAAHWSLRNSLRRGGHPTFEAFLTIWGKIIHLLSQWEPMSKFSDIFMRFHSSLHHGSLILTNISYQVDNTEDEERASKRQKKMSCKQELAIAAKSLIQQHESERYTVVYTDGSAEYVQSVGWIAGWGCHSTDGYQSVEYLPPHTRQSINRAELQAVIQTVLHYHSYSIKLCVCVDSAYIFGGVQGLALGWRAASWVTSQGPVTSVDQWIQLMDLLDTCALILEWIKVLVM